jgi:hypothetical protein
MTTQQLTLDEKLYRLLSYLKNGEWISLDGQTARLVCGTEDVTDLAAVINEAAKREYIDRWSTSSMTPGEVTEEHVKSRALVGARVSRITGYNILAHHTGARVV